MKILHVISSLARELGGPSQSCPGMARAVAALNPPPDIVARHRPAADATEQERASAARIRMRLFMPSLQLRNVGRFDAIWRRLIFDSIVAWSQRQGEILPGKRDLAGKHGWSGDCEQNVMVFPTQLSFIEK